MHRLVLLNLQLAFAVGEMDFRASKFSLGVVGSCTDLVTLRKGAALVFHHKCR